MAYISPFTCQTIKDAFEASAPGFTLKNDSFSNLASSVSYAQQRGNFIMPLAAGTVLSHPGLNSKRFSVVFERIQLVLNVTTSLFGYGLVIYQNGLSVNELKQFIRWTGVKTQGNKY